MHRVLFSGLCALLLPFVAAAGNADCRRVGDLVPLCIGHAAEDIEPLPDHRHLLLSNYGGWEGTPGTLMLLDTQTLRTVQLYPAAEAETDTGAPWGDATCVDPIGKSLSPHGIHLSRRSDGRMQLLVVNHGGRESIELFEVLSQDSRYRLQWRGCVVGPAGSFFNDVAALPGDEESGKTQTGAGFLVTQMLDRNDPDANARTARGEDTGHVLRWSSRTGFEKVADSDGNVPNGIQTTADGHFAFVNYSGAGELRKIDLQAQRKVGSIAIRQPDNIGWTSGGQLLEISQLKSMDFSTCAHQKTGFCDIPFAVYVVNPATLGVQKIFEHSGAPFGAATVATQMDDTIYLGTFAGDRIARLPAPRENQR